MGWCIALILLTFCSFGGSSPAAAANEDTASNNAATVPPLSSFPPEEQAKRREIIRKLSDPEYVQAKWVVSQVVGDNPLRDGFVPKGSDLRDFFDRL